MAEKPKELSRSPWMGVPFSAYKDENVLHMLETDLSTYKRHPFYPVSPWTSSPSPKSVAPSTPQTCGTLCEHIPDVADAVTFARASTVNKLVPQKEHENENGKKDEEAAWKFGQLSQEYKDIGKRKGVQRGIREYLASGYTRRNPDGKTDHDTDWRGKWKERNFQVAEYTWWKLDKKAYGDKFGDPKTDWASGEYKIHSREGDVKTGFSFTKGGIDAKASAKASYAAAQGKVELLKDQVISGSAEGALLKAEAEGEVAFVKNPEEITLSGKLGAKANVVEGTIKGELCVTPTRVGNAGVYLWNKFSGSHQPYIDDKWDIGLCLGGELQGAVGAQAEASAEAGVKNGKARAEAGVKLGLGLGGGAKASGGLTGLDKAADLIKEWRAK